MQAAGRPFGATRRRALAGLALLLAAACTGPGSGPAQDPDPPQGVRVPSLEPSPRAGLGRPAYLEPVPVPQFGTTLTRVSDQQAFGDSSPWLRNTYAKSQAWNADESLLLLGYSSRGRLLDGTTYQDLGRGLPGAGAGVWSSVDPDTFYVAEGEAVSVVSAGAGTGRVVRRFPGVRELSIGNGEGSPANDDSTLVLVGTTDAGVRVISYDPRRDEVLAALDLPVDPATLDWAASSQSGRHVVLSWFTDGERAGQGVDLYDRELRFVRHLYDVSEHADLGVDPSGEEVYVTIDHTPVEFPRTGEPVLLRYVRVGLDDGRAQTLLQTDWTGTHVSCRNLRRPGWCVISDALADRPDATTGGFDEVFALRLDASGTVERYVHAHQSAGAEYGSHAMAVPSRNGDRVLFGSDWLRGTPTYAYVVQQPASLSSGLRAATR